MNAKFDCIRRCIFTKVGGYDEENFGGEGSIGGEDAEIFLRLQKEGKVVPSEAKIIHLHYKGEDYSITNLLKSRKLYARTYGRLLRNRGQEYPIGVMIFLAKPLIAITPFLPYFNKIGAVLILLYAFVYTWKMFLSPLTLFDKRIIFMPFLNIFLLYYDVFWILEAFFIRKVVKYRSI